MNGQMNVAFKLFESRSSRIALLHFLPVYIGPPRFRNVFCGGLFLSCSAYQAEQIETYVFKRQRTSILYFKTLYVGRIPLIEFAKNQF
jgi:hypothetical protein